MIICSCLSDGTLEDCDNNLYHHPRTLNLMVIQLRYSFAFTARLEVRSAKAGGLMKYLNVLGYAVKKDTLIFLNNYELNMSEEQWTNPTAFDPSRFIDPETDAKTKPAHFLPFGGGKRSCMGYKLVQFLSFVFLANVVNNFTISPAAGEKCEEVSTGNLALPPTRPYRFEFHVRAK